MWNQGEPIIIWRDSPTHSAQKRNFSGSISKTLNDALLEMTFLNQELQRLNARDIAHRLWSSYHEITNLFKSPIVSSIKNCAVTVSTTVIKSQAIITATLGRLLAFAVVYDAENKVLGVKRLTKNMYSPYVPEEWERIFRAGSYIPELSESVHWMI